MTEIPVRSTGVQQRIGHDQMHAIAKRTDQRWAQAVRERKHLWVAAFAYFVDPPLPNDYSFDVKNLAMGPGIGCFICEIEWSPDAPRRCPGEQQS